MNILFFEEDFVLREVVADKLRTNNSYVKVVPYERFDFYVSEVKNYDIVILSEKMFTKNSLVNIRRIRENSVSTGFVLIFDVISTMNQIDLYGEGVDLVIERPIDFDLLVAKIKSIRRRIERNIYQKHIGDVTFNIYNQTISCGSLKERLNPAETQLMVLLMEGYPNEKISNDRIGERLNQYEHDDAASTAKVYVYRLRSKLKRIKTKQLAIKNHYASGYYLVVND